MSATDPKPPRKQKQKEYKSHPVQSGAERLKIVVRRLPPNLPEDVFWQSVQQWITDDTISWKKFCSGKLRTKRLNKEGIPSRAYIAFKNEEQVAMFSREYDGHMFRDKAGNESYALVEFAPFQKVPTEKKKVDARNDTIDKDEDYISFCETLKNAPKTESVSLETLIAAAQPPPAPTTTPLLEALRAEKSAQRDKEAILRNHPHYKDATASGGSLKKEEAKKKAAAAQAAKQQPEAPAPLSKKAKKAAAAAAASQKATSTQDGQGPSGNSQPPPPSAAPSTPKPATPVTIVVPPSRHRAPKGPHGGRAHPSKGDPSVSVPVPASSSNPGPAPTKSDLTSGTPAITESAEAGSPGPAPPIPGPRGKGRPTIGLGRQLEAALNGAGVAVAPGNAGGDRKKRDKGGGESAGTERAGRAGKQPPPRASVRSILQRPDAGAGVPEPMVAAQRPKSPREGGGSAGRGEGSRGGRRGRGRGRGG